MTTDPATAATGATTAGAANAGGTAAAAATGNAAQATPWTAGLDADAIGYVQNKGWAGPADVLNSYRNLEKLHGVPPDQIIKLPKDDTPEAWGAIYDKLGRPKAPADYGIKAPEQGGDPAFVEWAQGTFHELGLSAKQAAGLAERWNKYVGEATQARDAGYQQTVEADTAKLKTEWQGQYDVNVAKAKHAAKTFGLDAASIDKMEAALGFAGLMKLMHNIGSKLGTEDTFVVGEGQANPGFGMTKAAATARRAELMKDQAFGKRFAAGDVAARAEMRRLDTIISG